MYKEFIGKAKEIVAKMTLKEKIGQLNQINIIPYEKDMEKLHELIRNGQVGSLILANSSTAGNDAQGHVNVELYNELQKIAVNESRLGIPMIYGRDVIHGHRTVYPLPYCFIVIKNRRHKIISINIFRVFTDCRKCNDNS